MQKCKEESKKDRVRIIVGEEQIKKEKERNREIENVRERKQYCRYILRNAKFNLQQLVRGVRGQAKVIKTFLNKQKQIPRPPGGPL